MWAALVPTSVFVLVFSTYTMSSALPPPDLKSRVFDKVLSDEEHFNNNGAEHNREYDHEAFLGRDDVKEFEQLTPDESKEQLAIIYDKIDKDQNSQVTEQELADWIKYVQTRYIRIDTDRQWLEHNPDNNATLSWTAYKHRVYGMIKDEDEEGDDSPDAEGRYNYRVMLKRDRRRWSRADLDGDDELSKEEFSHFLHPEEVDHMKDLIVDETLEDIDKDKDGRISLEEYIGDLWPESAKEDMNPTGAPEWVETEREHFSKFRDTDKDGFMNHLEVKNWISPPDYDHTSAEAKHLIYESDVDKDGVLTKEEVLDKYEVFVGSQATDFGEALRMHDEF